MENNSEIRRVLGKSKSKRFINEEEPALSNELTEEIEEIKFNTIETDNNIEENTILDLIEETANNNISKKDTVSELINNPTDINITQKNIDLELAKETTNTNKKQTKINNTKKDAVLELIELKTKSKKINGNKISLLIILFIIISYGHTLWKQETIAPKNTSSPIPVSTNKKDNSNLSTPESKQSANIILSETDNIIIEKYKKELLTKINSKFDYDYESSYGSVIIAEDIPVEIEIYKSGKISCPQYDRKEIKSTEHHNAITTLRNILEKIIEENPLPENYSRDYLTLRFFIKKDGIIYENTTTSKTSTIAPIKQRTPTKVIPTTNKKQTKPQQKSQVNTIKNNSNPTPTNKNTNEETNKSHFNTKSDIEKSAEYFFE